MKPSSNKKCHKKCPRCKSVRVEMRLNSQRYCRRCGQRWWAHGLLVPSYDRRKKNAGLDKKAGEQLLLTI
ncbi:MAG: hypothetical protein COV46_03585 [Deltaproteobacteria bacterium CG11_big_fil_rev_8_21_14_0_20_49_13]|nr:MAG: hypothetical protein COV46_03585 [Deltaproteobacteria bacterium CG11_big_fil_rev_8_21_14_0_20_49_13]